MSLLNLLFASSGLAQSVYRVREGAEARKQFLDTSSPSVER